MAASLRRQRRKKILENREARLRLILGEKYEDEDFAEPSLETAVPMGENREQIECREHENIGNVAQLNFDLETSKRYTLDKEAKNGNVSAEVKDNILKTTDLTSSSSSTILKTTETNRDSDANQVQSESQTDVNVDSLIRVLLHVVLALILVIYEKIWKVKQVRIKNGKANKEAGVVYQPNESFLWPFLALEMLFLCIPKYRKISNSPSIAMVSVVLQLSGVSAKTIATVNLVLTSIMRMISDFCMFVFAVVTTCTMMDYVESMKLFNN